MARDLILICVSLIVMQLVVVSSVEEFDFTTLHDELRKLAGGLRKKCIAETGTTVEVLDAAEIGEFPDDRKLACYFNCAMDKVGLMKKDGKINLKLLSKMMPPAFKQTGMVMLEECKDVVGEDNCDLAYKFHQCLYDSNPVAFFVI